MDRSAAGLLASLFVSALGLGIFVYGKKQVRVPQLIVGVALMVFPYFTDSATIIYGVAIALVGGLWLATRMGW